MDGLGGPTATGYLRAAEKFGSIGLNPPDLPGLSAESRHFADRVFIAGNVRLGPDTGDQLSMRTGPRPPVVEVPQGASTVTTRGSCIHTRWPVEVVATGDALLIETEVDAPVEVRRYGDGFTNKAGDIQAGSAAVLTLAPDGLQVPWRIRLAPQERGAVRACTLG
jgi:hypothetical protein